MSGTGIRKNCIKEYDRWLRCARDEELLSELNSMSNKQIEDSFYSDLAFGTGGLRGVIGAGTNRINTCTVAKASQGLANYVLKNYTNNRSIAIAYDSRIKSDLFSVTAARVFAANGIKTYIFPEPMPTPCLSYAVREIGCSAGIVITASHNPCNYNGYKVYGSDGCQITTEAASAIYEQIKKVDIFNDIKTVSFDDAVKSAMIAYIPESLTAFFIEEVKAQSVLFGDDIDWDVSIVYSPLNGTGLKPVTEALNSAGFSNITVVEEQAQLDGNFPTCPYPNPEEKEAMELGLRYCEENNADLLLATDPDADRCGIAVRSSDGYKLLTGNEVGLLLFDYICSQRTKHSRMPKSPVFAKTIVTTDLAEKIAEQYGVETVNVLTGFKYIGELIGRLEQEGRKADFICGFEESYGYLTGTYVRDKDAVNAAFMISEMAAFYKMRGISLTDKLEEIYRRYGYCLNTLYSYAFEGSDGMSKMQTIMRRMREGVDAIGGLKVEKTIDYINGIDGLPKSDVIRFILEGGSSVVIRPSGTEPKLKVYFSVTGDKKDDAHIIEGQIKKTIDSFTKCL